MDIRGRDCLTAQDLGQHSLWKFDDRDDLIYPVFNEEDFPENHYDLKIRADFLTPSGLKFRGYIVGVKNVFVVAIVVGDIVLRFNKNMFDRCLTALDKLNSHLGTKLSISEFSPLQYTTTIDLEGCNNISGEFDLLKKVTDAERLEQ